MNNQHNRSKSRMRSEINDIPDALQRLLDQSGAAIKNAAKELSNIQPRFISTIARGSSDHACSYLKYAIELNAGLPVASIGPSIASIYDVTLKLNNSASISISQSGKSPDIVAMANSTKVGGALPIAITNDPVSPLASVCSHTIDICAGPEKSVAATKTFVNCITSGLLLLAHWMNDQQLLTALHNLPQQAANGINCHWDNLSERLVDESSLLILGRGPSVAIANEVALKFKETCQIHAESYSSAEVLHGPVSIVGENFPVLALAARDASQPSIVATADQLAQKGADVFATSKNVSDAQQLPFIATSHPLTDPLLLVISFYSFIENLAIRRGRDPDTPPNLKKVTETI